MALFGRRKSKDPGPPPGLDDMHSFTRDGKGKYPTIRADGLGNGPDGWAPKLGVEFPSIPNQDALLIHYRMPVPDAPESGRNNYVVRQYYGQDMLRRGDANEGHLNTNQGQVQPDTNANPTPTSGYYRGERFQSPRWTAYLPPVAPYSALIKPIGISHSARHLDGTHFSMASNRRSFPIGGMQAQRRFRNTMRVIPTDNSQSVTDAASTNSQGNVVYAVSPTIYGSGYRL